MNVGSSPPSLGHTPPQDKCRPADRLVVAAMGLGLCGQSINREIAIGFLGLHLVLHCEGLGGWILRRQPLKKF